MRDFESIKREILGLVDLVDVVGEHVALKQRGTRYVGLCPFHSEKTPSFTVTPDLGLFKCFGCGKGGDLFSFVQYIENIPFMEAMQLLADRGGVALDRAVGSGSSTPSRGELARVNAWAEKYFRSTLLTEGKGREAREYLRSRNISEQTSETFKLGLALGSSDTLVKLAAQARISKSLLLQADILRAGEDGRAYETFRNRLMFPIWDVTGRVIGFGGRTLVDDRAKYLNTRQTALFDKSRNLYGLHIARQAAREKGRVVVVEGYTDCIAAHQAGFTETVATLGVALSAFQVDLLRRYCDEMVLLFDSDEAGDAAAERAIRIALPRCMKVRLARLSEGKDPSEFLSQHGADVFSDVLKGAVDALEFKWLKTSARFKGNESEAARREAIMDFLSLINDACSTDAVDAIQRGLLVNQVAHLLRMDAQEINRAMARTRKRSGPVMGPSPQRTNTESRDEEQAAWAILLEALLAGRSVSDVGSPLPDFGRIVDERDRRIAALVIKLLESGEGKFEMADVLAGCTVSGDAERVEELARHGLSRGNYKSTIGVALERIRCAYKNEELERSKQRLVSTEFEPGHPEDFRDRFNDFVTGLREHRHFVPRRRRRWSSGARAQAEPGNDVAPVEQP